MKIKVVRKLHFRGASKKTGNPYDFIQVRYQGKAPGVIGEAALTLNLEPSLYPFDAITVPSDYIVDFNGRGFVVDFYPIRQVRPCILETLNPPVTMRSSGLAA